MSTKKSRYMRKREKEEQAAAKAAPPGIITECHEKFAEAYDVVANILETEVTEPKAA